jgi:uncharacterized protein YggE
MKTKTVLITALAVGLSLGSVARAETPVDRNIVVTGEGQVEVSPDMAVITLGVSKEDVEAGAAMAAVTQDMAAVVATLRDAGIAATDMQTQQISLHPVWSNPRGQGTEEPRKITGFSASNTLNLRVRDLDQLGTVLDQVLRAGANQFQGLRFDVADHAGLEVQLRADAVADAMAKAEQLAKAAGVTLGPVRSITDRQPGGGRPMMAMEMARGGAMPIEAGELSFTHNVDVVFDLQVSETK